MTCDMDYSSGADRSLLNTGGSMLSTPNLLPFLAIRSSIHRLHGLHLADLNGRQPEQPGYSQHGFTT